MISKKIKETKFYSLGGIQEIGKSSLVVEHDDEVILIDCGIRFANSIETGVQGIIPNYSVLKDKNVIGLFITHGHEDHIGGIPYLIQQVKLKYIYASNISIAYIRNRLNSMKIKTNIKFVEINKDFKFKSKHMTITSWTAQHSIPEAYGIIVKTINGTIMSTGDFRFDYSPINGVLTDFVKLKKLSEEGLTILCSDSTNSLIPFHSPTEQKIINDLEKYIKEAKGKIVFTTFASNVNRIKIAIDLAVKYNKKIIAFGKSMIKGLDVARNLKFIDVPNDIFIEKKEITKIEDNKLFILSTGSQGEERAALWQMVNNKHQYIRLKKNDIVLFSSSPIPGNKIKIELLINQIYKSGAEVKENRIDGLLHISGHAYQEEQRKLISLTKPKYFVPVHGFYRQAAIHGKTAQESGAKNVIIIKNGEVLSIKDGFVSKSNEVIEDNPIYIDSNIANFQTNDTILVRENLSQNGFVNVVALIDSEKKEIIGKTRIICRGSLYAANSLEEVDKIQRMAHGIILYSIKNSKSIDENAIAKLLNIRIKPYFLKSKRRDPHIELLLMEKVEKVFAKNNSN